MKQLSEKNLPVNNSNVTLVPYDRRAVETGVVHFGIGNFHRAHQAVYFDDLLCRGDTRWGITGISLRSGNVQEALLPQDFLYCQAILGEEENFRIIGSIKNVIVAPQNPEAVIDIVAAPKTQIVTVTITEKGYCLTSGKIDAKHPDFAHDMNALATPKTIYGYLAASLIKRSQSGDRPLTIICCDNIQGGGRCLEAGVQILLRKHRPALGLDKQVTFASSMVDRVTPATDERLRTKVALHLGVIDAWPVASEPFSQWVIENNFSGTRPALDEVGAIFVDDVQLYEQLKLRLLNAGHSIVAVLGYLLDKKMIHEALAHEKIFTFVRDALLKNILPSTQIPEGVNPENYIFKVLARFQNSCLPYAVLQVGTDSSQKIQQRLFPVIDDALYRQGDTAYLEFILAAWVCYIHKALSLNELFDPLSNDFALLMESKGSDAALNFIVLAGAENFHFLKSRKFMKAFYGYQAMIADLGIEKALEIFIKDN